MMLNKQVSRRQFLRIVAVAGVAGLSLKLGQNTFQQAKVVSKTQILMGTVVNLTVIGEDQQLTQQAITNCLDKMSGLESIFSRFDPESQLSRLNQQGYLEQAAPELTTLIQQSCSVSDLSDGAFDISVKPLIDLYQTNKHQLPSSHVVTRTLDLVNYKNIHIDDNLIEFKHNDMCITLDGIAKGYIIDVGVSVLRNLGFDNILIEAGGDLLAAGQKATETPWRIGLQSPRLEKGSLLGRFTVANQAVATSGDYMQAFTTDYKQHHILDPHTGYSAPDLAGATVIAPTAMLADMLATTLMVLKPEKGLELLEQFSNCQACLITKKLDIIKTTDMVIR